MIVAIDGPAGAGKSSAARAVAHELGFAHMDTGSMYRALTLAALNDGLDIADRSELTDFVTAMDVSLDDNSIHIRGEDVTPRLRSAEVTEAVSGIAALETVRAALVPLQRRLGRSRDIVVEGRDIGTVVFPEADVKVYLTASPEQRALRRTRQLGLKEGGPSLETLENEIRLRDESDATREVSPLQQAHNATRIDSTDMTLDQVVRTIVDLVRSARDNDGY